MTLLHRTFVAAVLAITPVTSLAAQRVAPVLDVGASSVRYAGAERVSATTVSPSLRVESANATVALSGTFSQITSGGSTTQGAIALSRFLPLRGAFHGELAGSAGGSTHYDRTRTGQLLAQGRVHLMGRARGAWLGAGLGSTWDGGTSHQLSMLDAGAWVSSGSATVLAAVTPTSVGDRTLPSLRYTDATLAARWTGDGAEIGASVGARAGSGSFLASADGSTWGSISAAVWIGGPVALAVSAGTYPIDYTQGYPGGRFASLALRLARRPASKVTQASLDARLAAGTAAAPGVIASFSIGSSADRRHRTIVVRAQALATVEVTGDFVDWQPVRMTRRADGRWTVTLPIPAGMHEIAFRADGGAWTAPPGLTTIRDEFGGTTGLLVIRD